MRYAIRLTLGVVLGCAAPGAAGAQEAPARTGWEIGAVPALNYDSDEGFGYGAIAELYQYGRGDVRPYVLTVQPTVFLTTEGRRDYTLFVDAPHLLPGGWRVDLFAGSEQQLATPYYGVGNETEYDPAREQGTDPYYYRFGRTRRQVALNLQHPVGALPLRVLVGGGAARVSLDPTPFDSGTTLLAREMAGDGDAGAGTWSNHLRAGLIWDTRDREVGARRGTWSELLVQRFDGALGSGAEYTRWTLTDRRYIPLGTERLVFANRLLLQGIQGDAPVHDLHLVQTSFKQQEGLGGAKTLRGVPRNRYTGEGIFLWNAELRWRAADFRAAGKDWHLVLSGFVDSGRVWEDGVEAGGILDGLHHGIGGGARLGMGEHFIVALDVGHSSEARAPFYIGLGYLF